MGFSEDRGRGRYGDIYLLIAENPYILWDAAEQWKAHWRAADQDASAGAQACSVDVLYGPDLTLDHLSALITAVPMFTACQLVLIKDIEKLPQKYRDDFVTILSLRCDAVKVLLTAAAVDKRLKWFKHLRTFASVEEFPRIYENDLPGWARRIVSDFGWSISPQAVEQLALDHGTDLFEMRQTIERAILHIGDRRRIEAADIETVRAGIGTHNVFLLSEAIARCDLRRALDIAQTPGGNRNQIALWLGTLFGQFQRLTNILDHPPGMSDAELARAVGLNPFIVKRLRADASAFGHLGLEDALVAAFETDCAIKTSAMPPRLAFDLLVYRTCRRRTLANRPWFNLESPNTWE
ncbi:MAG TPA: DNA polymerase III subunit delta [Phycisphaerae bacterium]|nr:DNA polymerase III subunit delta [Phycisphaerae bacterium]